MEHIYFSIESLMILHNILLVFWDEPEDIEDFDPTDHHGVLEEDLRHPYPMEEQSEEAVVRRWVARHAEVQYEDRDNLKIDGEHMWCRIMNEMDLEY